jgi:hypothetical protein
MMSSQPTGGMCQVPAAWKWRKISKFARNVEFRF